MARGLTLRELDWAVAEYVLEQFYAGGDEPPEYSKEMALAWPLVEKFKHFAPVVFRAGGSVMMLGMAKPVGDEWGCRFDCAVDRKERYVFGWGGTAAEAICRAALECANLISGNTPP